MLVKYPTVQRPATDGTALLGCRYKHSCGTRKITALSTATLTFGYGWQLCYAVELIPLGAYAPMVLLLHWLITCTYGSAFNERNVIFKA